ncbi:Ldh family oxidoreductase [Chelatococcus sambhunathii]|uniref:Ldh family oxidoreductase n=1 Tax=Chelatococcus sambhunathii TaxID=363953 RepID=A0ABU1DKI2_9HYPH|nr:Ldh family oxidoreductase [Chelatococcus sambhunathii]MDR4308642.1 Ldh family oxidoreductase [Chelatococcus sambhunathii]
MTRLSLVQAHELVAGALIRSGTAPENAASTARALVGAEADGLKGHGLTRTPIYAAQVKSGKVLGHARATIKRSAPAALVADAGHGFAYPAIDLVTDALPAVARETGVAAAAIRRSHHCGAAGRPVEALAEAGLVALMFANAPASMAPWGAKRPLYGTDPIAFACPLPGRAPIVIDMSLSKVARGNILAARQRGETIPDDWAFDAGGRPTTDPEAALGGLMAPMGGAKGVALALMVELLAAGLTGGGYAFEMTSFLDDVGGPPDAGQFILAIDPAAFSANGHERFAVMAEAVEAEEGARLPGARRLAARAKAEAEGIEIGDSLIAEIEAI